MTAKRFIMTAALLVGMSLGMTGASLAQVYYYGGTYGGYYDYAPGFAPYDYGRSPSNCERGGPGPRTGCSGPGIGAQR